MPYMDATSMGNGINYHVNWFSRRISGCHQPSTSPIQARQVRSLNVSKNSRGAIREEQYPPVN